MNSPLKYFVVPISYLIAYKVSQILTAKLSRHIFYGSKEEKNVKEIQVVRDLIKKVMTRKRNTKRTIKNVAVIAIQCRSRPEIFTFSLFMRAVFTIRDRQWFWSEYLPVLLASCVRLRIEIPRLFTNLGNSNTSFVYVFCSGNRNNREFFAVSFVFRFFVVTFLLKSRTTYAYVIFFFYLNP